MKTIDTQKIGLGDYLIAKKHSRETKLDAFNTVIDWTPIEKKLQKKLPRTSDATGHPAYPAIVMFKCLILQRLYNLSDVELEASIADRFSFLKFVGLGVEDDIPDSSTICRFRNSLLKNNLGEKLFGIFLHQLQEKGLRLEKGIAVDASVIQSSRHPCTVLEQMPEDRNEPDLNDDTGTDNSYGYVKVHSDDTEAAWVKKAGKAHYGYKVHAAVSVETGFILGGHVTPANKSDMNELSTVISEIPIEPGIRCYADKGYASAKNRGIIKAAGLQDGIMSKAARNRPLSYWEQVRNKLISSSRCIVERIFGDLKRNRRFSRSRYVGMAKVEQEFFLVAFVANALRAVTLMTHA